MSSYSFVIVIISWFVVGLISTFILFAVDLRGKEYDENYFDDKFAIASIVILSGYVSLFFVAFAFNDKYKFLQKLIYKIVNIGVKKGQVDCDMSSNP